MSILIKGFPLPNNCGACPLRLAWCRERIYMVTRPERCPLIPVPPHGDLIDRDALMKDGWLNLHKEVMRMGGYATHELPLKNPSIAVIIPAEEGE